MVPKPTEGIGETETQFFHQPDTFPLDCGSELAGYTLAYETYGELSPAKDNAILLFHALSGSQHAAGITTSVPGIGDRWTNECQTGWWDDFVGPGRALDTNRFFVVCVNYLGGCYGSTGPASPHPDDGKPYGSRFPGVTIADMVRSQLALLDELGVDTLHAAIGPSVGGLLALQLATDCPNRVRNVIPIASGLTTSPLQRLLNFEQILAVEGDGNFNGGDYYDGPGPKSGLANARRISHKTFVSIETLEKRARTEISQPHDQLSWYKLTRPLESYMLHQGAKFVRRFDANTYLRVVDAWQRFSLVEDEKKKSPNPFLNCQEQRYLVFSIDSDVCFYPEQQARLTRELTEAGVHNMHITVHSSKGHDSFLLEPDLFSPHLAFVLGQI